MAHSFRPAVRGDTQFMLGIAGPSRSGKTFSALRIAIGAVGGDVSKVFVIDTENGRALQYADRFGQFMHKQLDPPFTSQRYLDAIKEADNAKAGIIIIDSQSHEHEGEGGMLEQHEKFLDQKAGEDWAKRERLKFTAWIGPKAEHNRFVNEVLRINANMIFCFRAKDKLVMVKNAAGKNEPTSVGWTPICSSRFEYEMTSMLVLPEGSSGVPDYDAKSTGLRDPLDKILLPDQQLSENHGTLLAEWASGKKVAQAAAKKTSPPSGIDPVVLTQQAGLKAEDGTVALSDWWRERTRAEKVTVKADMDKTHKPRAKVRDGEIANANISDETKASAGQAEERDAV